ncbi:ribonuclease E inhibitor RraB [Planctobacterium marinum]|uniref:Regulator of ribonuclease activity B domain-containing protein n=1 Tax=Planctobacterium marinum TaxID=1631968 RepID=A0AA48HTY5_9ALTE|nr:hypothetical protein MACH26_34400 [Planctobacterium marinum]
MQSDNLTVNDWIKEITHELRHRNLNTSQRISLSFYIEHSSDSSAGALAKDLAAEGFDTDVDAFQQHLDKWRCWANIGIIPNTSNLRWIVQLLNEKSERFAGKIAGWETNPYESSQELGQLMARLESTWQEAVN